MVSKQIKSKERVTDFGEVFTNPREINAMLDLVKDESYRVDSRFLEPACGNGNFLVEILNRKLKTIIEKDIDIQHKWELHVFIAISNIYAIDIQADNCEESRERMYEIVKDLYDEVYSINQDDNFLTVIKYILNKNIILGDGLTGYRVNENSEQTSEPVLFSEWEMNHDMVKRKDFTMNDMVAHGKRASVNEANHKSKENNLFNLSGVVIQEEELKPIKEFKSIHFKEVYKLG